MTPAHTCKVLQFHNVASGRSSHFCRGGTILGDEYFEGGDAEGNDAASKRGEVNFAGEGAYANTGDDAAGEGANPNPGERANAFDEGAQVNVDWAMKIGVWGGSWALSKEPS